MRRSRSRPLFARRRRRLLRVATLTGIVLAPAALATALLLADQSSERSTPPSPLTASGSGVDPLPAVRLPGESGSAVGSLSVAQPRSALAPVFEPLPTRASAQPAAADIAAARRFAQRREGEVAFAVVDSRDRMHGLRRHAAAPSASLSKAMLLMAYLRAADRGEVALDPASRASLAAMIGWSDNAAASLVHSSLGDEPLMDLARRARMADFAIAGNWAEARVTAADQARFFSRLPALVPAASRRFAARTLAGIVPEQSWGIPAAAGERWLVRFKGGWRPDGLGYLVHQAGLLSAGGRRIAIAVLTEGSPTFDYGVATVRGIAERLLRGAGNPARPGPGLD